MILRGLLLAAVALSYELAQDVIGEVILKEREKTFYFFEIRPPRCFQSSFLFRVPALSTSKKSPILACASVTKNAAMEETKEWQAVVQSMSSSLLTCVSAQT